MIVDFHSHILPGIDDGSRSVSESLEMLREEAAQGISRVVLTPHFYPHRDSPDAFLAARAEALARLREAMEPGLPELICGAEVYYYPGISQSEDLHRLTVDGGGYLLLEMPMGEWSEAMYRDMERIFVDQGITPVIAHVDRYIGPFRNRELPGRLEELPVLVQANAGFFLRRSTRALALRMLRRGQIHVLGSDCHNMTSRRPNLGQAVQTIERCLGEVFLEQIRDYQQDILQKQGAV